MLLWKNFIQIYDFSSRGMIENNPEFLEDVLKHLAKEKGKGKGVNAVDMLHAAIVKAVEGGCDRELDSLLQRLEDGKV